MKTRGLKAIITVINVDDQDQGLLSSLVSDVPSAYL